MCSNPHADTSNKNNTTAGMETVVLKENIINGKNTLTSDMVCRENTIYVITSDYVIDGTTGNVEIAPNCILDFRGGSIIGKGCLTGNRTSITTMPCQIFHQEMNFDGTWNIDECYPEWFGAAADGENDDSDAITKCFELAPNRVILTKGTYAIKKKINIKNSDLIIRRNATIKAIDEIKTAMFVAVYETEGIGVERSINLKTFPEITGGGIIDCNNLAQAGFIFKNGYKIALHGLTIKYPIKAGISYSDSQDATGNMDVYDMKIIGNSEYNYNANYKYDESATHKHPIGIIANRSDCIYENCIIIDFKTSMVITQGCKLIKVHPWLAHNELWEESTAFSIEKNVLVELFLCEADTIQTFARFHEDGATACIAGCRQIRNTSVVPNTDKIETEKLINGTIFIDADNVSNLSLSMFGNRIMHSDGISHVFFKGDYQRHKIINLSGFCNDAGSNTLGTFTPIINLLGTNRDNTHITPLNNGITGINNRVASLRNIMYYHTDGGSGNHARTNWYNADGYRAEIYRKGTESTKNTLMPELDGMDAGVSFFNTDKARHEFWRGNRWMTYKPVETHEADMRTVGNTHERPTDSPIGFMYYDTTINCPLWHKGDNVWIDANGTSRN